MTVSRPVNRAQARAKPLTWAIVALGVLVALFGTFAADITHLARWIAGLGGMVIIVAARAVARSLVTVVELTDEGVTGPGFLKPVHIPWNDVVRLCDDPQGIIIQSKDRSTRVNLSNLSFASASGTRRISNFANPDEMVRFILSHIPRQSLLELHYWMPE